MVVRGSGKLKVTLPSDKEILLTRVFDAPRHLVYEVMTKPEYVRRWWACMEGCTMTVCDIDLRVGGKWRFAMVGPDGNEIAFNGEYREIVPMVRVVNTEIFEAFPDSPTLVTTTYEEKDGKTVFTSLVLHQTQEARDAHVGSGMEIGAGIAYDRVEEAAQSLASSTGAGPAATQR